MTGAGPRARDSPTLSSSTSEERAARRAYRLQQVEMMEQMAMGLGLERQNSMKLDDCLRQMEKLNNENRKSQMQLQSPSTLKKEQPRRSMHRFMGVLRRNDSDDDDDDDQSLAEDVQQNNHHHDNNHHHENA